MFRKKVIKSLMLAIGIIASTAWVTAKRLDVSEKLTAGVVETIQTRTPEAQKKSKLNKYVPEVIIEAKWQKLKEKFVPIEGDPWRGWISCATEIYGGFRTGTVSFYFWHQNVEPYPPVMPRSITIDEKENLYILDPAKFRVLKFDRKGGYLDEVNLERIKPKKGHLGRFEIAEGCDLGEKSIKIHVEQDKICIKGLEFSKTGRFIGTNSSCFEEKGYKQVSPGKVIKDDGIVYEIVLIGRKEKEKKEKVYKLDPSDKRIKNTEGIERFLKRREEFIKKIEKEGTEKLMKEMYGKGGYPRKDGKITLYVIKGRYEWYEKLRVIKWQKKD
jgi:hypothetical protein